MLIKHYGPENVNPPLIFRHENLPVGNCLNYSWNNYTYIVTVLAAEERGRESELAIFRWRFLAISRFRTIDKSYRGPIL